MDSNITILFCLSDLLTNLHALIKRLKSGLFDLFTGVGTAII